MSGTSAEHAVLVQVGDDDRRRHIAKPDGSLRCPEQQCPEGQVGYAPHCEYPLCLDGTAGIPPNCQKLCPPGTVLEGDTCKCPPGTTGTSPNCEPHADPKSILKKVVITPKFRKITAGKKVKLRIKIRAEVGLAPRQFRIKLRSSNHQVKVPKSVVIRLTAPTGRTATGSKVIRVKAKRKARRKAKITASNDTLKAHSTIKVKPTCVKKKSRKAGNKLCGKTSHL